MCAGAWPTPTLMLGVKDRNALIKRHGLSKQESEDLRVQAKRLRIVLAQRKYDAKMRSAKPPKKKREILPFEEARAFMHTVRLKSQKEWKEWCKGGARPHNIPTAPFRVYANDGCASSSFFVLCCALLPHTRTHSFFSWAQAPPWPHLPTTLLACLRGVCVRERDREGEGGREKRDRVTHTHTQRERERERGRGHTMCAMPHQYKDWTGLCCARRR